MPTAEKIDPQAIFNLAVAEATLPLAEPAVHWILGDDKCDCIFQRIGEWANPYLGRTLRVRMCCIWAELYKQYPEFVQELPYYDANRHKYNAIPSEWDNDKMDMPLYLWYRQLAIKENRSLPEIRKEYSKRKNERPKRVSQPAKNVPTKAEIAHARTEQLKASGWIVEG